MTAVIDAATVPGAPPSIRCLAESRLALLGLGNVGRTLARLIQRDPGCLGRPVRVEGALVRYAGRHRSAPCRIVEDPSQLLDARPDVLVEVLGGLEPARRLVVDALERGIPVVTANKSLLAVHGEEISDASRRSGAPVHFEAAVLAGVPFLSTFGRRPLAAAPTRIVGILNGTSNFVLSRVASGIDPAAAIAEAQHLGLAEPDPSKDLAGADAAEKLTILIRQFFGLRVHPGQVRTESIDRLLPADLDHARELGGTLKPLAFAESIGGAVACWAGPAFLFNDDPIAHLSGVLNAVRLETDGQPPLCFTGPGAGPEVTARTILDDVGEVLSGARGGLRQAEAAGGAADGHASAWYVRLRLPGDVPGTEAIASLAQGHATWIRRWSTPDWRSGTCERRFLTFPCTEGALESALRALAAQFNCTTQAFPVVQNGSATQFPQQIRRSGGAWRFGGLVGPEAIG
jgi:homoserine dehydrogenase